MNIEDMDEFSIFLHVKVPPDATDDEKCVAIFEEISRQGDKILENYDKKIKLEIEEKEND